MGKTTCVNVVGTLNLGLDLVVDERRLSGLCVVSWRGEALWGSALGDAYLQQPVAFVAISVRECNLLIHILHSIALG